MGIETLWTLSLQTIFDLLEAKFWNSTSQNPFSQLPHKIVLDIECFIRTNHGFSDDKTFKILQLIFESGHITKFDVFHWNSKTCQKHLPNILNENFCKHLVSLSLPKHFYTIYPVGPIISSCSRLVEAHLPSFVDLDLFDNCPQLEILRFHASDKSIKKYFLKKTGDLPPTIRKLKVFTVCSTLVHYAITKDIIAKLLLNNPKLISVGCCNSLEAFQWISETQDDIPSPFHLRRCYWGFKYSDFIPVPGTPNFDSDQPQFSRMVKLAISMCPSIEELVIDVYDNNCVKHLVKLKNLTTLSISYEDPFDENYQTAFASLLREIGSQLKHLSVSAKSPIPADVICKTCSNVETLRLLGKVTLSDIGNESKNLPAMRSLCVHEIQNEALLFLFQTCPNMKELFIDSACNFKSEFVDYLLNQDAIPKLEIVSFETCSLSSIGLEKFLNAVPTLRKVSIDQSTQFILKDVTVIIKNLIKTLEKNIEFDSRLYKKEYFRVKTHPCVF